MITADGNDDGIVPLGLIEMCGNSEAQGGDCAQRLCLHEIIDPGGVGGLFFIPPVVTAKEASSEPGPK